MNKRKDFTYVKIFVLLLFLLLLNLQPVNSESFNSQVNKKNSFAINEADNFHQNITNLMEEDKIASLSLGIIKNNSLEFYGGYGDYKHPNIKFLGKTPEKDTVYMAGSVSKSFTATAVLQLYEEELFDLNDNISLYLPFDLKNPNYPNQIITVKMLLNHTSSLSGGKLKTLFTNGFLSKIFNYPCDFLKQTLYERGRFYQPDYWRNNSKPGSSFEYANFGFSVLECLIENITGQSYEKYCDENIFKTLEMYNSSFHSIDFKKSQLAPPFLYFKKFFLPLSNYDVPFSAAGGLRTSVEDLSHFLIAHMNNGIYKNNTLLKKETIEMMHNLSASTKDVEGFPKEISGYGLGWIIRNYSMYNFNFSGHGGNTIGSDTAMYMDSDNKIGIIFFKNSWNIEKILSGSNIDPMGFIIQDELLKKAKQL